MNVWRRAPGQSPGVTASVNAAVASKPVRLVRALTWAQYAYFGWFAACVAVVLARAAHYAGHLYVPSQADGYTDNVDVWAGWMRPFRGPMMLTACVM